MANKKVKIHFHGGARMVSGSCFLIEVAGKKFLVECGLFQGLKELEKKNFEKFGFDAEEIEAVVVTHSHLDHVGRLPQLFAAGFRGKIYSTPPTADFTRLILEDSVKILAEKTQHAGVLPLFSQDEVDEVMNHFVPVEYYKKTKILPGVSFIFHNAGHILGSAIIELDVLGKKLVFSGDIGHPPAPLLPAPDTLESADYVFVESTYGDRNHETPDEAKEVIENVIEETIARGGVLMIPSFAMERTQQLLYHLNELVENKRIPHVPIFIDSPLATHITEVYKNYPQYYNKKAVAEIDSGDDIFNFPGLRFTVTSKESKEINEVPAPKIIIAGSGMSQGGRIVHHEVRYLPDEKSALLQVGYQAEGTLGRLIHDGVKKLTIKDQLVEVRAKIEKASGYSAHGDQRFLMKWLGSFRKVCYEDSDCRALKKVFVVHGEEIPAQTLAGLVRDELGVEARVPQIGEAVELA